MMRLGRMGESLACAWLTLHGYEIVERNYRSRFGEIDIIANRRGTLYFIEVKTRERGMIAPPSSAVDLYKQQKIIKTAAQYMTYNEADDYSFDVVEVVKSGLFYKINFIRNAFEL